MLRRPPVSMRGRLLLLLAASMAGAALPPIIRIGAVFTEDQKDSSSELAFKYAVYRINKDKTLLPNTTIVYDIQYVPRDDSFRTSKKVCRQLESGVQALFGPSDAALGTHIQSICEALDVPHIEARSDAEPVPKEFSINLYPAPKHTAQAFQDLLTFLGWSRMAIVYEDDTGLFRRHEIVNSVSRSEVYILQTSPVNYREVLKDIKRKQIFNLVVDTNPLHMTKLFRAILQLQMNDDRYHYMFTTFDIEIFDLEDFKYNGVNITAFRLVDVSAPNVMKALEQMERFQPIGKTILNRNRVIQAESALMYDSVHVFAAGLTAMDTIHALRPTNLSCDLEKPFDEGLSLYNYINSASIDGLTGKIEFNEGKRNNFKLDLMNLRNEELLKVGEWIPTSGINISSDVHSNAVNVTLVVVTKVEKPYVMLKHGSNLTGNAMFEGFCIDLLKLIARKVGFRYNIHLVPDNLYGTFDAKSHQWNGIVGELIHKQADIAVAPMTIDRDRQQVIDFTKPFMNFGIGVLFKTNKNQSKHIFSFMNPLDIKIWLYMLASYVVVSFTFFVIARFSPYGSIKTELSPQVPDIIENQFTVSNSFWFITGTLLRRDSGLNPKATSKRVIGGVWWFFTLIIISSYTANLAAFRTVDHKSSPIRSTADLADQTDIAFGTLRGGSTMNFFKDSKIEIYQKMWQTMVEHKSTSLVPTYEDGVQRTLQGNYAFLMESTMLDYVVRRNCLLKQIGGLLDSKSYGIATTRGSPFRDKMSLAIVELRESGEIQRLYDRWWQNSDPDSGCDGSRKSKANALGAENLGGLFLVLACGLSLAVIVAVIEFYCNTHRRRYKSAPANLEGAAAVKKLCADCSPIPVYAPHRLNGEIYQEGNVIQMVDMRKFSLSNSKKT